MKQQQSWDIYSSRLLGITLAYNTSHFLSTRTAEIDEKLQVLATNLDQEEALTGL